MRAGLATVVLAVAVAVITPARADAASDPPALPVPIPAPSTCGQGSWVAGTVDLCAGELVYRDYVYDDFGARPAIPGVTTPQVIEQLKFQSVPTFDAYGGMPAAGGRKDHDQTDLVALRIRVSGGQVHVTAELNTMTAPDAATLAVAIDTDADAATGGGPWPDVAVASNGWDVEHAFTTGDPNTNLITGTFPQPAGAHWRIWAVVAQPDGTPMNVAFRGVDETGIWWEDNQADALAAGDITQMAAEVDVADLTGGTTRRATVAPGARRERVYISQTPLGEGISDSGVPGPGYAPGSPGEAVSQAFTMLGKYQPYGFYEPTAAGPHGVQLALHGLAQNHAFGVPGISPAHFDNVMGEERNRLLAMPLGRGWKGWYSSYSERDVWDVLADVEANYPVDANKVVMSGYSMGGYGAMRIAALHPDVFAGVVNWVGYTGDFFNGTPLAGVFFSRGGNVGADVNAVDVLGSLRHVPMAALYSGADELVTVSSSLVIRQRLSELHVPSIFYLHPAADHLTYYVLDDWRKESAASAGDVLVRDPAHVTFRTDQRLFVPDLGLVPDRAYWLSEITPAGAGFADIDAVTLGCGGADEPVTADVAGAGTDPVPWESNAVTVTGTNHRSQANRLEITATNVASVRVDETAACLDPQTVDLQVTSAGPLTVVFSNGVTRTVEPAPAVGASSATAPTTSLARTGSEAPTGAVVALVAAVAVRVGLRRRRRDARM